MSERERTREEILEEIRKKTVRYHPAAADAAVAHSAEYAAPGGPLPMDLWYPSQPQPDDRLPAVVIVFGFRDPEGQIRQYGPMTSWAKLIASAGMVAVLYGTREPAVDVHALIQHLRERAGALNLDRDRIGLFSVSGSVPTALLELMRDATFRAAALACGYTMDVDGSTIVADMAAQYGFVNACAGKSAVDLPDRVPMLFVRAGRDQFPGVNDGIDRVVRSALARNLPVTLVNHATGLHGFEYDEDSVVSRGIVQQVLAFLRLHVME